MAEKRVADGGLEDLLDPKRIKAEGSVLAAPPGVPPVPPAVPPVPPAVLPSGVPALPPGVPPAIISAAPAGIPPVPPPVLAAPAGLSAAIPGLPTVPAGISVSVPAVPPAVPAATAFTLPGLTDAVLGSTGAAASVGLAPVLAGQTVVAPGIPSLADPGLAASALASLQTAALAGTAPLGEIRIPQQYVGWLKGTKGGQLKAVEERTGATVSINQDTKDLGYSIASITGPHAAVGEAQTLLETELVRVMERDGYTGAAPAAASGVLVPVQTPLTGDTMAETQIPQKYVGWLKGSGGSQIKDMETRSGAVVRIDQTTRELGYSVAQITGNADAVIKCKALIDAEIQRVQERDRVVTEHSTLPPELLPQEPNEIQIPQQYVGWIKGAGGSQIKDIEGRTGAHVTIDQSTQSLGYSRAVIYGTDDAIREAKRILLSEIERCQNKDGSTRQLPANDPLSTVVSLIAGVAGAVSGARPEEIQSLVTQATANVASQRQLIPTVPTEWETVRIPNACVGWLKGKQGAMIREIESRSGAQVDIDQTEKDTGYSIVKVRGSAEQQKTAYGLVVAEVMKVADNARGETLDCSHLGTKDEFRIDVQYVGWVKGPKGKVVQDIQVRSATRIDVDQNARDVGQATVKIFGTHEGSKTARNLIANELRKVAPELAAEIGGDASLGDVSSALHAQPGGITGAAVGASNALATVSLPGGTLGNFTAAACGAAPDLTTALAGLMGQVGTTGVAGFGGGGGTTAHLPPPEGQFGQVRIPNSCVGWLKGRQGAMIREIETRSGCQVDIDQTTRDQGFSIAMIRGNPEQQKLGYGLVVAEVMKVADNSGEFEQCKDLGTKDELRIDVQYVGWVKGPRGKVVQDIQVRSGTRVDVDQTSKELGFATVKIFGTHEGVQAARRLIAAELSKISPDVATSIDGAAGQLAAVAGHLPLASPPGIGASLPPLAAPSQTFGQANLVGGVLAQNVSDPAMLQYNQLAQLAMQTQYAQNYDQQAVAQLGQLYQQVLQQQQLAAAVQPAADQHVAVLQALQQQQLAAAAQPVTDQTATLQLLAALLQQQQPQR